jgi:osmotically-inducible protein OsmY
MDRLIEDAALSSYNYRALLGNHVKVEAKDGVVTLTGTVNDRDQRALAEDTVSDLPGVVRVTNKIQVESEPPEHSDGWIALKVRALLLIRANVSAASTHVEVKDGAVTLTGTAASIAEKELTEAYVKDVDGVKSVKNDLVVANTKESAESSGQPIDDASITAQVKFALLAHRATSAIKTKVTTVNGVITVRGDAGSGAERDLVTELAKHVRGVKSVDNEMTVNGLPPVQPLGFAAQPLP